MSQSPDQSPQPHNYDNSYDEHVVHPDESPSDTLPSFTTLKVEAEPTVASSINPSTGRRVVTRAAGPPTVPASAESVQATAPAPELGRRKNDAVETLIPGYDSYQGRHRLDTSQAELQKKARLEKLERKIGKKILELQERDRVTGGDSSRHRSYRSQAIGILAKKNNMGPVSEAAEERETEKVIREEVIKNTIQANVAEDNKADTKVDRKRTASAHSQSSSHRAPSLSERLETLRQQSTAAAATTPGHAYRGTKKHVRGGVPKKGVKFTGPSKTASQPSAPPQPKAVLTSANTAHFFDVAEIGGLRRGMLEANADWRVARKRERQHEVKFDETSGAFERLQKLAKAGHDFGLSKLEDEPTAVTAPAKILAARRLVKKLRPSNPSNKPKAPSRLAVAARNVAGHVKESVKTTWTAEPLAGRVLIAADGAPIPASAFKHQPSTKSSNQQKRTGRLRSKANGWLKDRTAELYYSTHPEAVRPPQAPSETISLLDDADDEDEKKKS